MLCVINNNQQLIITNQIYQMNFDKQAYYGATVIPHVKFMQILWGPIINIIIFLIFYSYRKIWWWVHVIVGLFAVLFTTATILPIFQRIGIIDKSVRPTFNRHQILGLTATFLVILVGVLGLATRLVNILQGPSKVILLLRKLHTITGYLAALFAKLALHLGGAAHFGYLIFDIIWVILVIVWKFSFPRLESKQPEITPPTVSVKSIRELDQSRDYVVFGNHVYDASALHEYHPAGNEIIKSIRGRQVDRYIYGSTSSEELIGISLYSHSYKSLTLLGDPVAQISILPTFDHLDSQDVPVAISSLNCVSQKGRIFEMALKRKTESFQFLKYKDITQLGRYYSLTLNEKVTRLYTTVNFVTQQNKHFLSKLLSFNSNTQLVNVTQTNLPSHQEEKSNATQIQIIKSSSLLPVMFRAYNQGKFTEGILNTEIKSLSISYSKGQGLILSGTPPGKIIIVAGGTGMYPYSDLIDLLYKQELLIHRPQHTAEILQLSPILEGKPFKQFTFVLLCAFNVFQDIHPITYQQLLFLGQQKRVKVIFKIKEKSVQIPESECVRLADPNQNFEKLLEKQTQEPFSRVWICGPPKMNEGMSAFMRRKFRDYSLYLIV